MTAIFATQIEIDSNGVAWLAGTKVKVVEVVLDKLAYGWSPEEIHFQHPHLSLAQIHAALTYHYESQSVLDAQIALTQKESMRLAFEASDPAFQKRLSDLKKPFDGQILHGRTRAKGGNDGTNINPETVIWRKWNRSKFKFAHSGYLLKKPQSII